MKQYTVEYLEDGTFSPVKKEIILAKTVADAYFDFIEQHATVYSAWVARYTKQDGSVHYFNNFSGKPF